jgi:hypothetical protein
MSRVIEKAELLFKHFQNQNLRLRALANADQILADHPEFIRTVTINEIGEYVLGAALNKTPLLAYDGAPVGFEVYILESREALAQLEQAVFGVHAKKVEMTDEFEAQMRRVSLDSQN